MVSSKEKRDGAADTAPPHFTSGDNLNVDDVPYLQPAPRQPWEPYGWACRFQAARWRSEGLADYNPRSANPSDVWANDIAYHYPPTQGHGKKGNCALFLDRIHRSYVSSNNYRLVKGRQPCYLRDPGASPSSLAWAGTYPHGWYSFFKLQGNGFLSVHSIAQEKGQNLTPGKNFL